MIENENKSIVAFSHIYDKERQSLTDIGDVLINDNGEVRDTKGESNLTISNSKTLEGKTINEIIASIPTTENQKINTNKIIKLLDTSSGSSLPENFNVAVTEEQDILFWGNNLTNLFCFGATAINNNRITIGNPHKESNIKTIVASSFNLYVLYEDGELYVMGKNSYGCLGLGNSAVIYNLTYSASNVEKIIASNGGGHYENNYAFVIKNDKTVFATGRNIIGQLGTLDLVDKLTWTKITLPDGISSPLDIVLSGVENASSFILCEHGEVLSCGYNAFGQLGLGDILNRNYFSVISSLKDRVIKKLIANGGNLTGTTYSYNGSVMALSEKNDLYVWGSNATGNLGLTDTTNRNAPSLVLTALSEDEKIEKIYLNFSATSGSSYFITNKGNLYGTGANTTGQLGVGDTVNSLVYKKIMSDVEDIICINGIGTTINSSVFVIKKNKEIYVFGLNTTGQLGQNNIANILSPTKLNFEHSNKVKQISFGGLNIPFVHILLEDGKVFGTGNNASNLIVGPASTYIARLIQIF
ncbi:RCC1 domain-containing protein [Aliarcobacter butzleri]